MASDSRARRAQRDAVERAEDALLYAYWAAQDMVVLYAFAKDRARSEARELLLDIEMALWERRQRVIRTMREAASLSLVSLAPPDAEGVAKLASAQAQIEKFTSRKTRSSDVAEAGVNALKVIKKEFPSLYEKLVAEGVGSTETEETDEAQSAGAEAA